MDCSLQITADVLPPNALFVQIKLVVLLDSHYFCCVYVTACVCVYVFLCVQKQVQQYVEYSV